MRFHEACGPKGTLYLLMTIVISHRYPLMLTWPLMPIDICYIYGLCASVCSNHWQTLCVWAPYPIHHTSVINDINHDWAPLYPFMYTLGYWTFHAPPGLHPLNLLMDSSCLGLLPCSQPSQCPGPPHLCVTQALITRGNPLLRYSTRFQRHWFHSCGFNVSPRLVSDEGGMTFGYLWQVGLLKSYCSPF